MKKEKIWGWTMFLIFMVGIALGSWLQPTAPAKIERAHEFVDTFVIEEGGSGILRDSTYVSFLVKDKSGKIRCHFIVKKKNP